MHTTCNVTNRTITLTMSDKANQQELLKEQYECFVKTLDGKTEAELREIEEQIIKESDEYQQKLNTTMFALPAKGYTEVAKAIHMLLDKQTVQWQYTLGIVTMYEFWDEEKRPKEVNYPTLDGTLRTLGALSFTGYPEWKAVLTINDYFEEIREKYVEATNIIYLNAEKHNAVMDKLKIYDENIPTCSVGEDGGARIE